MALRDAVKSPAGAQALATGPYDWRYGTVTVFGFLALPEQHIFLKFIPVQGSDEYQARQ